MGRGAQSKTPEDKRLGEGRQLFRHLHQSMFFEKQPVENYEDTDNKHKKRNPVDPMHRAYITVGRRVRILLFNIKIFSYLPEHSHMETDQ